MGADSPTSIRGAVGDSVPHDSGHLHVSGEATYTDDILEPKNLLHLAVGLSSKPHARIRAMNLDAVTKAPGVVNVITADDIPGANDFGPVVADDPILAPGLVQYAGQPIFAVAAETIDQARKAARLAVVDYRHESKKGPPHKLSPETVEAELAEAGYRLIGAYDFLPEQYFLVFATGDDR